MPARVTFKVEDWKMPYRLLDADVRQIANGIRGSAAGASPRGPTGALGRSWTVTRRRPAEYRVETDVVYARFPEYGTRHIKAVAMLGRAVAAAGGKAWRGQRGFGLGRR